MFVFTYGSCDPHFRNITRNNFRVIRLPSQINLSICESELAASEKNPLSTKLKIIRMKSVK